MSLAERLDRCELALDLMQEQHEAEIAGLKGEIATLTSRIAETINDNNNNVELFVASEVATVQGRVAETLQKNNRLVDNFVSSEFAKLPSRLAALNGNLKNSVGGGEAFDSDPGTSHADTD